MEAEAEVTNPSESQIKSSIRTHFGKRPEIRLFNNAVGGTTTDRGSWIDYGLAPGSSDLVGWITFRIGQFDIGVPIFFEVKDHRGRPTQGQLDWIRVAREMGCIAGVVRCIEDCEQLIGEWATAREIEYRRTT